MSLHENPELATKNATDLSPLRPADSHEQPLDEAHPGLAETIDFDSNVFENPNHIENLNADSDSNP